MKASLSVGRFVIGSLLIVGVTPLAAQQDGSAEELRLLRQMNVSLSGIDGNTSQLKDMVTQLKGVQQRLDALIMSGWEYRLVSHNRFENLEAQINSLGRDGWELVGVTREEGFVFKRRVTGSR